MKRSEVRAMLKSAKDAIKASDGFGTGRISEFAAARSNNYPYLWVPQIERTTAFDANFMPINAWTVSILIAQLDKMDSTADQYEALVDESDFYAQKFTYQLNQVVAGYKLITIQDLSSVPFIKKNQPDVTTGVTLSFTITDPDKTDVC